MKNIIYTLLFVVIIVFSGVALYSFSTVTVKWVNSRSEYLENRYEETGRHSYLLELSITRPKREIYEKIIMSYLKKGDYQLASFYNTFVNMDDFDLKAAESALERQDSYFINKYLDRLDQLKQKELNTFVDLDTTNNGDTLKIERPETDLGKISNMIIENDFTLYKTASILGTEISSMVEFYPKTTEQNLMIAKLFNDYKFHGISRRISSRIISEDKCIREAYLTNSQSYEYEGAIDKAYGSLENYNKCNPADTTVLNQLLSYAQRLDDETKIDNIKSRLDIISDIK